MKQSNTSKYAYLAGMIDADGYIGIKKCSANKYISKTRYEFHVQVGQKDGRIVDYLYGIFGGNVVKEIRQHKNGKKYTFYSWRIYGSKAKYILKRLIPFLRYKKKQAELGVRYQERVDKRKKGNYINILTDRELSIREKLYQEMKKLKKEWLPSVVAETKRDDSSKIYWNMKRSDSPSLRE